MTPDVGLTTGARLDSTPGGTHDAPPRPRRRHPRRPKCFIAASAVLLAALISVAIWQALSAPVKTNLAGLVGPFRQPAPPFSLPNVLQPGQVLALGSFRGRPLVVNFWASWCVPCRTEMPLLEAAFRAEHGKVAFLGVDVNDTDSAARAFLTQVHVTYPVVSDPDVAVATKYGIYGLPTTVFISPVGKFVGRHIGELHPGTLPQALKGAFGV